MMFSLPRMSETEWSMVCGSILEKYIYVFYFFIFVFLWIIKNTLSSLHKNFCTYIFSSQPITPAVLGLALTDKCF